MTGTPATRRLWLVGLSHHSAPIELRERLAVAEGDAGTEGKKVLESVGFDECALLSTCNRVEVVGYGNPTRIAAPAVADILASEHGVAAGDVRAHLYVHEDRDAARHLFRVASSLDSMVVGEPQILGQLKASYEAAVRAGTAGSVLHRVFHKSFSVAKRVRSETGIGGRGVSVSSVAVDLATQIFETLGEKTALVIGAGKMAELTARHFRARGIGGLMFANRTFDRAVELAREFNGTPVAFDDLARYLPIADVIIGSAAAGEFLLRAETVQEAIRERNYRPTFLIDLGVPRNFEPRINDLPNVYLYDIDDLEGVIGENREQRSREAARAEEIVTLEVETFWRWFQNLEAVPTIVRLRGRAEDICRHEVARTLGAMASLKDEDKRAIEAMAQSIVNKLLHEPISRLRRGEDPNAEELIVARRLFGLDEDE